MKKNPYINPPAPNRKHLPPLPVCITTDSCVDLTSKEAEEWGVSVVSFPWTMERAEGAERTSPRPSSRRDAQTDPSDDPFCLNDIEKHQGKEGGCIEYQTRFVDEFAEIDKAMKATSGESFYEGLASGKLTVKTACASPDTICDFFIETAWRARRAGRNGDGGKPSPVVILHLSMSSGLSTGNWEFVNKGARMAESEDEALKVIVIDTKAATLTQKLAVKYAAALVKEKPPRSKQELSSLVKDIESFVSSRLFMTGYLGDLSFLQRTGRTSRTKAWAGKLLGLHPMATYNKGTGLVDVVGMTRLPKALKNVLSKMGEMMGELMGELMEETASSRGMRCDAHSNPDDADTSALGKSDTFPLVKEIILGYTGPAARNKCNEFLPCLRALCPDAAVSASPYPIGNVAGAHMGPETFYVTWRV